MKCISALCAISTILASTALLAGPVPVSDSGLVTLIAGQTAQVNVVNLGLAESSCKFNLSLVDSTGTILPLAEATLPGGSALYPSPTLAIDGGPTSLRAHIDYSPQLLAQASLKDPLAGCYNLVPTLEVIDESGTRVIVSNFVAIPSSLSGDQSKITICHKPGSHAEQSKDIPMSAWGGHHGHGDTLGPCSTN